MKSVIIRLIAGLLLLVVGAAIFINTFDIYPFKGYHVYECSLCGYQWSELKTLEGRFTCKNFTKVENPETGKKENVCKKKLCAIGVEDKKAEGNYVLIGNNTKPLIINTVGGVVGIAGFALIAYTGWRAAMNKNTKKAKDED